MRFLVTGAGGQVGSDLVRLLTAGSQSSGDLVIGLTSAQLDVTNRVAIASAFAQHRPDVLINAAAYTAVDNAETDEERAHLVNATGPALLALAAAEAGTRLIHVSTDYVFDGTATRPYEVDDDTAPRSVYGRTKLAGEQAVRELAPELGFVVRTAWVYGETGGNFVKTMIRLERTNETLDVVDDQKGSPTWSRDLAAGLIELARSQAPAGTYHCTNGGETTWHGLARAVFEEIGADPSRVHPTTTDRFPRPAPRPAYSVLSGRAWSEAGLTPLPGWRTSLTAAMPSIVAAESSPPAR